MKHDNIIDALEVKCPFPQLLDNNNIPKDDIQIGYIRADYDGCRWWNTVWPKHDELATPEIRKEIDMVYSALVSDDVFTDLDALRDFCLSYPNAVQTNEEDKYNFFLESRLCWYWLQCITRNKDYNLYLHAYPNTNKSQKVYFSFLDAIEVENPACKIETQIAFLCAQFPELSEDEAIGIIFRWQVRFISEGGKENESSKA